MALEEFNSKGVTSKNHNTSKQKPGKMDVCFIMINNVLIHISSQYFDWKTLIFPVEPPAAESQLCEVLNGILPQRRSTSVNRSSGESRWLVNGLSCSYAHPPPFGMNIVSTHTTEHGYKEPPLVEWRAGLKGYQLIHNMHPVEEDTWNHRFTEEILHIPLKNGL